MPSSGGGLLLAADVGAVEARASARSARAGCRAPGAGWRSPCPIMRLQQLERGRRVAPVDGVGEVPRRHPAGLAEERLDSAASRLGAGPVGRAQQVDEAEQPARSSPTHVDEPACALRSRPSGRPRPGARRPTSLTLRPGLVSTCGAADLHDGLQERLGHACRPATRARATWTAAGRRGSRTSGCDQVVALPLLGHRPSDHAVLGQERRRLGRVDQRAGADRPRRSAHRRRPPRPSGTGPRHRPGRRRAAATASRERRPRRHHAASVHRDRAHAPAPHERARTAAITSAVRRAPRTSWARRIRQPSAMPRAWAACDASRRSSTVGADQVAEEPLVRRRQEQRASRARPAGRGPAGARATAARRLAEVEAGVDHHPLARDPGRLGRLGPVAQEPAHRVDDRLVVAGSGSGTRGPIRMWVATTDAPCRAAVGR